MDGLSAHCLLEAWSLGYVSDTAVSERLPFETFGEIAMAAALSGLRLGGQARLRMHLCGELRAAIGEAMAADGFPHERITHLVGEDCHPRRSVAA
jgi:hypothetical protein